MKPVRLMLTVLAATVLAGCAVGPDYQRPAIAVPAQFKEAAPGWKVATPAADAPKGDWWTAFGDPLLNDLIAQLEANNQTVQLYLANYRRARAAADAARAGYYPTVSASGSSTRARSASSSGTASTRHTLSLDASWEPDLWGSVARSVEAGTADAEASAADLANARLSAQAELVQDYLQLRVTDQQLRATRETVAAYERTLRVTRNQYEAGLVTRVDVATAESQVRSAEASLLEYELSRRQYEHAIAILVGRAPAEFSLPPAAGVPALPGTPAAVPSALLERRPDIASAERAAASANANIGVAQSAFYPNLTLSGGVGGTATRLADILSAPARTWSLGASLAQLLFDGGAREAQLAQARASYDAAVAQYRQTVLQSFQEVEDNLAALAVLSEEAEKRDQALAAARDAERLALNQYQAGLVDFTTVASAQISRFQAEVATWQVLGRRYSAHALLVKALGGGWDGALTPEIAAR